MSYMKTTNQLGFVQGKRFSAYFGEVQRLKREARLDEAIASLLEFIEATEEDDLFTGAGVASAYYEELAKIYRKRKDYANEIKILTRYARQRHASRDPRQEILRQRLEQAKKLFIKKAKSRA